MFNQNVAQRRVLLVVLGIWLFVSACTLASSQAVEVTRIVPQTVVVTQVVKKVVIVTLPPTVPPTIPPTAALAAASQISGRLCFPSEVIPPMTIYARNSATQETYSIKHVEGLTYQLEVPKPGAYLVFAWTAPEVAGGASIGGVYSCQSIDTARSMSNGTGQGGAAQNPCTDPLDHAPLPVTVAPGAKVTNIDICDFYSPESVPLP